MKQRMTIMAFGALAAWNVQAQLTVDGTLTPIQLVEDVLVGNCVGVSNITFNGVPGTNTHPQAGSFNGVNSEVGLANGVILATGSIQVALGPNNSGSQTLGGGNFGFGDPDLTVLAGVTTNDAAILEFDFVPTGETISFRYVFASEEYNEYVCATVNDVFGFFLSGPGINGPFTNNAINLALVPGTEIPISINTVNNGTVGQNGTASNCSSLDPNWQNNNIYYTDNAGSLTIQFDGQTVVMEASAQVQCGETYHIKLAIADGGDTAFDSAVFLEAGSFSSQPFIPSLEAGPGVEGNTIYESCFEVLMNFVRTGCELDVPESMFIEVGGTATPGVDYFPAFPTEIVFQPGESVIPFTFNVPIDEDGPETLVLILSSGLLCNDQIVTNEFEFILESAPLLVASGGFAEIPCTNQALLNPSVSGGLGGYTYQWSTNETTPTITVSPTQQTTYTVTVTDTCGVQTVGTFIVAITPPAPLVMNIIGPNELMEACDQTLVNFIRPLGTMGDITVQLTYSGTATNDEDVFLPIEIVIPGENNNITMPVLPIDDGLPEGTETLTVTGTITDPCGQTVTASVTITIIDAPEIDLFTEDLLVECAPDSILLFATASGGVDPLSFSWADGTQGPGFYAQIQTPGTYEVTVTDGCGRTETGVFNVEIDCDIIIPNVFTPNNDGQNDFWVIDGIRSIPNTVRVFNRWGNVVFEANNYQNNWRGTGLPDGTYFYEVKVERRNEVFTGHLTILSSGRR